MEKGKNDKKRKWYQSVDPLREREAKQRLRKTLLLMGIVLLVSLIGWFLTIFGSVSDNFAMFVSGIVLDVLALVPLLIFYLFV